MHTLLYVSGQTATAVVNIATLAVIFGAVAAIYTHEIFTGLLVLAAAFLAGTLSFAYSVWRLYRPRRGLFLRT
jgi:hydroxymethylglutaryl-CoA reductase